MKFGKFELHDLTTSHFGLDGGAMFGVVPKVIWNKTNPADELNRIDMVTRSILIQTEGHHILIDTGMGEKWADKYKDMYKIDTATSNLKSELARLNLTFDDITEVILTHLHFDHTGGSTIEENGILVPAFPNATFYCTRENWEWANNPSEKDRASYIKQNFTPLHDAGKLKIIDSFDEFPIPEIDGIISNGHTTGMWLPRIKQHGKTVVYCADLIPMSSHIPIPFVMGYDLKPLVTIAEKKALLKQAADEQWILIFEHDPNYVACTVSQSEKGVRLAEDVRF